MMQMVTTVPSHVEVVGGNQGVVALLPMQWDWTGVACHPRSAVSSTQKRMFSMQDSVLWTSA